MKAPKNLKISCHYKHIRDKGNEFLMWPHFLLLHALEFIGFNLLLLLALFDKFLSLVL